MQILHTSSIFPERSEGLLFAHLDPAGVRERIPDKIPDHADQNTQRFRKLDRDSGYGNVLGYVCWFRNRCVEKNLTRFFVFPRSILPTCQVVQVRENVEFSQLALCSCQPRTGRKWLQSRAKFLDSPRSSDLFSKSRDRQILTYLSQKVVEGYSHRLTAQDSKGRSIEDTKERMFPLRTTNPR